MEDPESESDFEEIVSSPSGWLAEGLVVDPDEADFMELDPLDDADFEELVEPTPWTICPTCCETPWSTSRW